jgi:hypothetical protein
MGSKQLHHLAVAAVTALAFTFAAGVQTAATSDAAQARHADELTADLLAGPRFDYFPSHYQDQAKEIEPLPAQF